MTLHIIIWKVQSDFHEKKNCAHNRFLASSLKTKVLPYLVIYFDLKQIFIFKDNLHDQVFFSTIRHQPFLSKQLLEADIYRQKFIINALHYSLTVENSRFRRFSTGLEQFLFYLWTNAHISIHVLFQNIILCLQMKEKHY